MKFLHLDSFIEYLNSKVDAKNIPAIVCIKTEDDYEKHQAKEVYAELLKKQIQGLQEVRYDFEQHDTDRIFAELGSLSFFSKAHELLVIDNVQILKKTQVEELFSILGDCSSRHVFLSLGKMTIDDTILQKIASYGCFIEIPEEKPWDKQTAIMAWIEKYAKKIGIIIEPDAKKEVSKAYVHDKFLLQSELEKLSLYVCEKGVISLRDVEDLCFLGHDRTFWQLHEAILDKNCSLAMEMIQAAFEHDLHPLALIKHTRASLHTALKICTFFDSGLKSAQIHTYFPQLRGKAFEKLEKLAIRAKMPFIRQAILALDDAEVRLKSSVTNEQLFFELRVLRLCV